MNKTPLQLDEIFLLEPHYFEDARGHYCETYSARTMLEFGIDVSFVQDAHSLSISKGTIRGIHFQNDPKAQAKLVRCIRGKILDVVVDLRKGSPSYRKWISVELSAENRYQIWIPKGFGHAFLTLSDNAEVLYKFSDLYYPELYRSIAWNDPEIGVDWGEGSFVISDKDKNAPLLKDSDVNFL